MEDLNVRDKGGAYGRVALGPAWGFEASFLGNMVPKLRHRQQVRVSRGEECGRSVASEGVG